MKFENSDVETGQGFRPVHPTNPDGSISAFRSGDTSALRALETIVEPGTVIGAYEVGRLIGRGGIAAVYDAVSVESGEAVALKILDARFTGAPEIVTRFINEAETLASFSHPNIVQHISHGRDETFVYLAMEYVPGINLDQLMASIELESHHYVHLAHEISKGLTAVHSQGLIHGDIKPSNILVTKTGDVKLSDFGAARSSSQKAAKKVHGTSTYMAPELLKQDHSADFRADIYSLAVTFYKLFTGKTPPQPYTAPGELNPGLPEGVNAVLARALEDNPEHRHVTVKEFADDLAAQFDENVKPTPVPITPDRQSLKAAEAARIEQLAATRRKEHEGIDWRLVLLCGAVAVVIAVATVVLMSGR